MRRARYSVVFWFFGNSHAIDIWRLGLFCMSFDDDSSFVHENCYRPSALAENSAEEIIPKERIHHQRTFDGPPTALLWKLINCYVLSLSDEFNHVLVHTAPQYCAKNMIYDIIMRIFKSIDCLFLLCRHSIYWHNFIEATSDVARRGQWNRLRSFDANINTFTQSNENQVLDQQQQQQQNLLFIFNQLATPHHSSTPLWDLIFQIDQLAGIFFYNSLCMCEY